MQAAKPLFDYPKYWAECFGPAPFLPMSREEMDQLGWDSCDIIIVTGDAYVDHPSFGMAIIVPPAGGPGVPRRHHRPAGLAVEGRLHEARRAEPVLRRGGRQHGLDDQPLHRGQEGPFRRRLHPRRPGRQAPGPRQPGLQPALQGGLQPCAGDPRRDRGLVAPYRPLRLLAGQGPPLDPDGRHGRHPALRQRRACGGGNRPAPGPGRTAERDHRRARHRLRPSRHPGGLVRDRFHADRPVRARSTRSSIPT